MKLTRRAFNLLLLAFLASVSTLLTGCPQSVEQVLAEIEKWAPTVIAGTQQILSLLAMFIPGAGAAAAILATITGIVNSILGAITEYQNADPTTKTTLIGKIRDWLQAISDNLTGFVSGLNLSGNPIVKVVGILLSVIVSAITGYINLLPIMQHAAAKSRTVANSVTVGGQRFQAKPKFMDKTAFVSTWNTSATQNGHPEACIYDTQIKAAEAMLKAAKS